MQYYPSQTTVKINVHRLHVHQTEMILFPFLMDLQVTDDWQQFQALH